MASTGRISDQIAAPVRALAEGAHPRKTLRTPVKLCCPACMPAAAESDLDLLVIQDEVPDRAGEMVRLRRLLRPLRIPTDVLIYSADEVQRWGAQPGSALYWALREGKVLYG